MYRIFILLVLSICTGVQLHAQKEIKGVVINAVNNAPVDFANIGFPKKGVGTISSHEGEFTLIVPDSLKHEPIVFSHINYKLKQVSVDTISDIVTLQEDRKELAEVLVLPSKLKSKWMDKGFRIPAVSGALSYLGEEVGVPLYIKKTALLRQAKLQIKSCSYDSVVVRINLYQMNNGEVGDLILKKPLYTTVVKNKKKQEYIVDFEEQIKISNATVMLSMECVAYHGEKGSLLLFPVNKGTGYAKYVSLGEFNKIAINTGMALKVTYLE